MCYHENNRQFCACFLITNQKKSVTVSHYSSRMNGCLHLHALALGNVPLTCGWFCERGLVHHKPFWKHQAKPATFLLANDTTRSDHSTWNSVPYSLRTVRGFFYLPQDYKQWRTGRRGLQFYRPCPRRLGRLTICRCNYKGSTFYSVI